MPRTLAPRTNLDVLRKEAKRWRKAIEAGDADATARYAAAVRDARPNPKLREVQHALAGEYGFASWASLKQEIEDRARSHAERVALFLEKSAHRYSVAPGTETWGNYERDTPARGARAARLLARHPEIARDSLHTAVAAGDLVAVRDFLQKEPALADKRGGPDGWTPLLRLAYTRLPTQAAETNAAEIARLLLDHGADPRAQWSDGQNPFKVLTGVIGGGEGGQPAHPQAEALARLLIARGADPLDGQALYNTSLGADDTFWLDLLWSESEKRGESARWRESVAGLVGPGLDYLLGNAVPRHPNRVAWLLAHGARADALNAYSKRPIVRDAAAAGRQDLVDLLVAHGAERPQLDGKEQFLAAAMLGDAETLRRLAQQHPDVLHDPAAMFAAADEDRTDVAELLLDVGMSPDVADSYNYRALHRTTHPGAVGVATLLIGRGAEVDPVERCNHSTPLGHANYHGRQEMIAVIAPVSRDVLGLCFCGAVERLKALLAEDPTLASRWSPRGELPLFCLPDDDERAVEVAELLLAHGADKSARNAAGLTPAQVALQRGLEDAADLLGPSRTP